MSRPRIDQALPTFGYGDAIGNNVLALRAIVRGRGIPSEVFAGAVHPRLRAEARDWGEYRCVASPEDVCLFHFSIGSPIAEEFARSPSRRVLIYHNVTPAAFARGVSRRMERECRLGREQLRRLAGSAALAIGDSEFNRRELEELGYAPTAVLPVLVDLTVHDRPPLRRLMRRWRDGAVNVLHVGRLAPNKRIEDVIKAFHFLRRIEPRARLLLVGTEAGLENYGAALRELVARLGTPDVHFLGHVEQRELSTYYRVADLYLMMSEHEGFCVPLLEAMRFGVPIVAYAATAVPETLGGAGVLVRERRFEEVAELMRVVLQDAELRRRLVAAGRERLARFAPERIAAEFWEILARHGLAGAAGPARPADP